MVISNVIRHLILCYLFMIIKKYDKTSNEKTNCINKTYKNCIVFIQIHIQIEIKAFEYTYIHRYTYPSICVRVPYPKSCPAIEIPQIYIFLII